MKVSPHILYVDDEIINCRVWKMALEQQGFQVTVCDRGEQALEAFRAAPDLFDIVITDQTMPSITGMNLAEAILHVRPDLPVLLCSGWRTVEEEKKFRAIGIYGFMIKPYSLKDLTNAICNLLTCH